MYHGNPDRGDVRTMIEVVMAGFFLLLAQFGDLLESHRRSLEPRRNISVVEVNQDGWRAVGLVIEYQGEHLIITSQHAVDEDARVRVCYNGKCKYAEVLLEYAEPDIAVIRSPWNDTVPLEVSFNFFIGQDVTMTSPVLQKTVKGKIVGTWRAFLKYDAQTEDGFSGSPVMNDMNQVVGVHRGSGEKDNLAYAVTMTEVFRLLDRGSILLTKR